MRWIDAAAAPRCSGAGVYENALSKKPAIAGFLHFGALKFVFGVGWPLLWPHNPAHVNDLPWVLRA